MQFDRAKYDILDEVSKTVGRSGERSEYGDGTPESLGYKLKLFDKRDGDCYHFYIYELSERNEPVAGWGFKVNSKSNDIANCLRRLMRLKRIVEISK